MSVYVKKVDAKKVDGQEIDEYGNFWWWKNGVRHRTGGPAVVLTGGFEAWYQHGHLHREDGPALIFGNGDATWYFHGKLLNAKSQEEFEHWKKLKAFW